MAKIQKYGIKFPTQIKNGKYLLDVNTNVGDNVKSQLVHLIFTPEGQRLRDPLFGTKLIQYIFNPNDGQTWEDITLHIKEKVSKYVANCNIISVEASQNESNGVSVKIIYTVKEIDGETHQYELIQNL